MLFVTVGSQKFQFDRLLRAVDALVASGIVEGGAFAQTGACSYVPESFPFEAFLDRQRFGEFMDASDVVITHGGTGAIIGAVKRGKKVIAVPRLARFGEHVNDHQVEIVRQFAEMDLVEPCYNIDSLSEAYERAFASTYRDYSSNTQAFIADLGAYIENATKRSR